MQITHNGNYGVRSQAFEHDPNKIYRLKMRVKKNQPTGFIYVGLSALSSFSDGHESTSNQSGNRNLSRISESRSISSTGSNMYFYRNSSSGNSPTDYVDIDFYILGANVNEDEFPDWDLPDDNEYNNSALRVADPDTPWIAVRILNWSNGGDTTSVFVRDISVVEVGPSMVVRNQGNVGIGTLEPTRPLDVYKDGTDISGEAVDVARFAPTEGSKGIGLGYYDSSNTGFVRSLGGNSNLSFWTHSGSWGERMRISSDGNVGIGTVDPSNARLHIEGSGTYDGMVRIRNTGTGGANFFMGSTNNNWDAGSNRFIMGHGTPSTSNINLLIRGDNGWVGIGTTNPRGNLHLGGPDTSSNLYLGGRTNTDQNDGMRIHYRQELRWSVIDTRGDQLRFRIDSDGHGSSNFMSFSSLGHLGIGITPDGTRALMLPNVAGTAGRARANAWNTYSSIRYKENITPLSTEEAIEKIMNLNPVSFNWKEEHGGSHDIGFIAEEVGTIIPEAVEWDEDGEYADDLNTDTIVPYLTRVIQKQQNIIDEIRKETCEKDNTYSWCNI